MQNIVNFRLEAIYLIKEILASSDKEKKIIKSFVSYGASEKDISDLLKNHMEFTNRIKDDIKEIIVDKGLEKYFAVIRERGLEFIYLFMLHYETKKEKESIFTIVDNFYNNLLEFLASKSIEKNDDNTYIKEISALEVLPEVKIMMIEFYLDYENIIKEFNRLIDCIAPVIEKYYHIIENDCIKAYEEVSNKNYLKEKYEIDIKKADKIYIAIFTYNKIEINSWDLLIYYVGYLVFKLVNMKNHYDDEDEALSSKLKVMTDSTRFQIIKLLVNKEMYNNELSRVLNLSGATLSYHLDLLVNNKLLLIKRIEKKKCYYQTNKETISLIIKYLERLIN